MTKWWQVLHGRTPCLTLQVRVRRLKLRGIAPRREGVPHSWCEAPGDGGKVTRIGALTLGGLPIHRRYAFGGMRRILGSALARATSPYLVTAAGGRGILRKRKGIISNAHLANLHLLTWFAHLGNLRYINFPEVTMAQVHIKLDDALHKKLKRVADNFNFSLQEFVEKVLSLSVDNPEKVFSPGVNKNASGSLFRFVDLFSGIGGIRLAFEKHGGECVFSSEWDKWSQKTYFENFREVPHGDIDAVPIADIPQHDILTAGFPCQPFSIAGVSKKQSLGMEHGFRDKTQGTLFFNVADILDTMKPKAFLLENVKNLISHDKKNTFRIILETLDELNYHVFHDVIDAKYYVPQHRERLFIVGFHRDVFGKKVDFSFPAKPKHQPKLSSILEEKVDSRYILTDKLWQYLQDYSAKHKAKGNGFGFGLFDGNSVARTLSARYYKDGSEILIKVPNSNPRRLTPRECARLMGFDDTFKIPVSDTQAYRQFGNSVVVPAVAAVAAEIVKTCKPFLERKKKIARPQ